MDEEEFYSSIRFIIILMAIMLLTFALGFFSKAHSHEIYLGLHGKDNQLCCGANDCAVTTYREDGGEFRFLTREKHWLLVPTAMITFLPIPGDIENGDSHKAHLCYDQVTPSTTRFDRVLTDDDGNKLIFYCAFIPPGSI
jgi:hypothetical protein